MTTPNQVAADAFGTVVGEWGDLTKLVGQGAFQIGNAAQNWGQQVTEDVTKALIYGPATLLSQAWGSIEDFLAQLGSYLGTLPLEALKILESFIPGVGPDAFSTINSAVQTILNAFGTTLTMTQQAFEDWLNSSFTLLQTEIHQLFDIFNNLVVTPVTGRVASFASWWQTVGSDLPTAITNAESAVQSIEDTVSNVLGSTAAATSSFGGSLQALFGGLVAQWTGQPVTQASGAEITSAAASTTAVVAEHSSSILEIEGQLQSFYGGSGSAPLVARPVLGTIPDGFTAVSSAAVNSLRCDTVQEYDDMTVSLVCGVVPTEYQYLYVRGNSDLSTAVYLKYSSGASYLIARVGGIDTQLTGALPGCKVANTQVSLSAVGNVFTCSINGVKTTYTDATAVSQVGPGYRYSGYGSDGYVRQVDTYTTSGTGTYTPPSWLAPTDRFVVLGIGGGGGGQGGSFYYTGEGGYPGSWQDDSFLVSDTTSGDWNISVGAGGAGGGPPYAGYAGAASSITIPGYSTVTAGGGAPGSNLNHPNTGRSPGSHTARNLTTVGGAACAGGGYWGNPPGGGGGGGTGAFADANFNGPGGNGGAGAVWIYAIHTDVAGPIDYFSVYSGVKAGPATDFIASAQNTNSSTYSDLTTVGPTVTANVGSSGMVLVALDANMVGASVVGATCYVGVALSGANTVAATDSFAISYQVANLSGQGAGICRIMTGLTPGVTTFTMKYRYNGSGYCNYSNRSLTVVPL